MGNFAENVRRKQETVVEHARILVAEGEALHAYIMAGDVEKPKFHGDMGEGSAYFATWVLESDCNPTWYEDLPPLSKVRADEHFYNISQWNLLGHAADITSMMMTDPNATMVEYYERIKGKSYV
jgi:hypothetical protein